MVTMNNGPFERTCWFWSRGGCRNDFCKFAHYDTGIAATPPRGWKELERPTSPQQVEKGAEEVRRKRTCWFWTQGTCKNGIGCSFSHGDSDAVAASPPPNWVNTAVDKVTVSFNKDLSISVARSPRAEGLMSGHGVEDSFFGRDGKSLQIKAWLIEQNVTVYNELSAIRSQGWESEAADKHFERQRKTADAAVSNENTQRGFFKKMVDIAREMNQATSVFRLPEDAKVLDLCIAPGAFSSFILLNNQRCYVEGTSLPVEQGGHKMLIDTTDVRYTNSKEFQVTYLDVTLQLALMPRGKTMPETSPDFENFTSNPSLPHLEQYDLALCDGQALRMHEHAQIRSWEPARLLVSQLILSLTHLKPHGSMLVLLHNVERWRTVYILYRFSQFSKIRLYKPTAAHTYRSSFYLVAQDIDTEKAAGWVDHLRDCWYRMTFEGEGGTGEPVDCGEDCEVDELLEKFGTNFIGLAHDVWTRQFQALKLKAREWV